MKETVHLKYWYKYQLLFQIENKLFNWLDIHVYGYGVLVAADIDTNVRGSESWFKFYVQKNDHS